MVERRLSNTEISAQPEEFRKLEYSTYRSGSFDEFNDYNRRISSSTNEKYKNFPVPRSRSIDEYTNRIKAVSPREDVTGVQLDPEVGYKLKTRRGEDFSIQNGTRYPITRIRSSSGDVIADVYCCDDSRQSPTISRASRTPANDLTATGEYRRSRNRRRFSSSSDSSSPGVHRSIMRTHTPHVYQTSPTLAGTVYRYNYKVGSRREEAYRGEATDSGEAAYRRKPAYRHEAAFTDEAAFRDNAAFRDEAANRKNFGSRGGAASKEELSYRREAFIRGEDVIIGVREVRGGSNRAAITETAEAARSATVGGAGDKTFGAARGKTLGADGIETAVAARSETAGAAKSETSGAARSETAGAARVETVGASGDKTDGAARGEALGTARIEAAGTARSETAVAARNETAGTARNESFGPARYETVGAARYETVGAARGKLDSKFEVDIATVPYSQQVEFS